jgi:alkanesulfonate monooxygenase SsuD/methylene tetrahydromethanopterin reductase-like flavin-dependent oxidoreductase (luciferase family)
VVPRPLQKPHPRLWQTCGSPESFYIAGEMGVGALGTTLLSPVSVLGAMMREHDRGLADCKQPAGFTVNPQKGAFTFVHLAESRAEAIRSRAAWSALWYVNAAAETFKVPRRVWYDMIKAGLHPNSAAATQARASLDPQETVIEPDDPPVLVLLKKMAQGESVSREQAHETLEPLDCVVIGDPDHCAAKLRGYEAIGVDRIMCMMQYGALSHEAITRSLQIAGRELIPAFAKERAGSPA